MIKKAIYILTILFVIICLIFVNSCRKDDFTTSSSDKLTFSKDTIQFDTIFTNVGSATRYFTVRNTNKSKSLNIDRIFVAKESNSKYKLNINGVPTNDAKDIVLAPGDSIHIFVIVKIDPNRDEMIEQDSIVFISNGNIQDVKLIAYGQDVTLINGQRILNDTVWTPHKPILIYDYAWLDSSATLIVEAGTKVYFHKKASLLVFGSLKINGDINNRVLFTGDRLEPYYNDVAGQWGYYIQNEKGETTSIFGGIHLFESSRNNEIYNADIKNSIIGLQVSSSEITSTPTVILKNTNIENSQVAGLYALGAYIEAENCVFANSGKYNVGCMIGGKYSFIHCTMANYWVGNRQVPQLMFNNYSYSGTGESAQLYARELDAYFGNCIIYGSRENEIGIDKIDAAPINLEFNNCMIKYGDTTTLKQQGLFVDNLFNKGEKDKIFKNTKSPYDYELDTLSPAMNKGKISIAERVPYDQLGVSRLDDGKPDIGAYERVEVNLRYRRK
jgi:hypothetical protein